MPPITLKELADYITSLRNRNKEDLTRPLRLALYLRKSTDDKEKQQRSLGDQRKECEEYATRNEITINPADIYEESESAKEPGIRIKFRKMLDRIISGELDGLLCWSPDRLSRNMRESGEILDLLDRGTIRSLHFVTQSYDGTSSAKLTLTMLFALAKQYSDNVTESVDRGNRESLQEGRGIGKEKHGYYRDSLLCYRPDGKNWALIKEAWQMRLNNVPVHKITKFLQDSGYRKAEGSENEAVIDREVNDNMLFRMFKDCSYCGLLKHGEELIPLVDKYDFLPVVSVEDYCAINNVTTAEMHKVWKRQRSPKEDSRANLLKEMVHCGYCLQPMLPAITTKYNDDHSSHTDYFYFRCTTAGCTFHNKSERAKVIFEFVYDFLNNHDLASPEMYQAYQDQMKDRAKENRQLLLAQQQTLSQQLRRTEEGIVRVKRYLPASTDPEIQKEYEGDLKVKLADAKAKESELKRIKKLLSDTEQVIVDYARFVELFSAIPDLLRKTPSLEGKDKILRQLFLNFTVTDKKVTAYELAKPVSELIDRSSLLLGGRFRNRT